MQYNDLVTSLMMSQDRRGSMMMVDDDNGAGRMPAETLRVQQHRVNRELKLLLVSC